MDALKLIFVFLGLSLIAVSSAFYIAYKDGYVNFLTKYHMYALVCLVLAGIFTWAGLYLISHPGDSSISGKQKVSLIVSIIIGVMIWFRYSYVNADKEN